MDTLEHNPRTTDNITLVSEFFILISEITISLSYVTYYVPESFLILFYLMFSMSRNSMDHFPLRRLNTYSFSIYQEQSAESLFPQTVVSLPYLHPVRHGLNC